MNKKDTAKVRFLPGQRPQLADVTHALRYWGLFDELSQFFAAAHMPVVSRHLAAACQEIDRIWKEEDFDSKTSAGS